MRKPVRAIRIVLVKKKWWTAIACLCLAALIFGVVNYYPAAVGASAAVRQLPIYCVQRDQKLISISFDAAWGDVRERQNTVCHNVGPDSLWRSTAAQFQTAVVIVSLVQLIEAQMHKIFKARCTMKLFCNGLFSAKRLE